MIIMYWDGKYYILVSINNGLTTLYFMDKPGERGAIDRVKSISTVDFFKKLKSESTYAPILIRKKNIKTKDYEFERYEFNDENKLVESELQIDKEKLNLITGNDFKWIKRNKTAIKELKMKIEKCKPVKLSDYINSKEIYFAFPIEMSGDLIYIIKMFDLVYGHKEKAVICAVDIEKSDAADMNDTKRILLVLAMLGVDIYVMGKSNNTYRYEGEMFDLNYKPEKYANIIYVGHNSVKFKLEDLKIEKPETKAQYIWDPFACTGGIGDHNFRKDSSDKGLLSRLYKVLSSKEAEQGFDDSFNLKNVKEGEIKRTVLLFNRKTDYHPLDNTTKEMAEFCLKPFEEKGTQIVIYGKKPTWELPKIKSAKVRRFDPFDLLPGRGELSKFFFWFSVVEKLEKPKGHEVVVLGPRSGSVDTAAMYGLQTYTWRQFGAKKENPLDCGELRLLMSAPLTLRVRHWNPLNDMKSSIVINPNNQNMTIELRFIDPDKLLFNQKLTKADRVIRRNHVLTLNDLTAPDLGNVVVSAKGNDIKVGDATQGLKLVELHIITEKEDSGNENDLDSFLAKVRYASGGQKSHLQYQLVKHKEPILKKGNHFIYRFYDKNQEI